MISKAATLRKLLKLVPEEPAPYLIRGFNRGKGAVIIPGAFNAASALLIERCGFRAVYMSGAGISNSAGLPDTGILRRDDFIREAVHIAEAVNIPVIADADTGFGGCLEVKETVRRFERAGVAGIQIEDQKMSKKKCGHLSGKEVISAKAMAEKIKAACDARRNKDFVIIARTDARGVTGFEDAVRRGRAYAEAGADMIFPEALESKGEFGKFARMVDAPLMANMTEFGKTPCITVKEFEAMGYSTVIFPMTAFRVGMKAMEGALFELKRRGTQKGLLKKMQTRKALYRLLRYKAG